MIMGLNFTGNLAYFNSFIERSLGFSRCWPKNILDMSQSSKHTLIVLRLIWFSNLSLRRATPTVTGYKMFDNAYEINIDTI